MNYYNRHILMVNACIGKKMRAQAQSGCLGKLGYLLLLLLVEESLSLCVLDDDRMNCTNSSLLLVSRTELKENGYSIIVNQLPNISTNCTTLKKEINAKMGGSYLQLDYLDKDKTSVEVYEKSLIPRLIFQY